MKKTFTFFLLGVVCISACRKEKNYLTESSVLTTSKSCQVQTADPSGRIYSTHDLKRINYTKNNCGLIPLNIKNYWVYKDSIFINGIFENVSTDTLRFVFTCTNSFDSLIWWRSNFNVGLPDFLYATDFALFALEDKIFAGPTVKQARNDFSLFEGDSSNYLTSFQDIAAQGRSLKIKTTFNTPAGSFANCIYVEKNARNYRKDQLFLSPGLGVLKYIHEEAPVGKRDIKLQQVSTLVAFHIE